MTKTARLTAAFASLLITVTLFQNVAMLAEPQSPQPQLVAVAASATVR